MLPPTGQYRSDSQFAREARQAARTERGPDCSHPQCRFTAARHVRYSETGIQRLAGAARGIDKGDTHLLSEYELKLTQSYASKRGGRLLTDCRAVPLPAELPKGQDFGARSIDGVLLLDKFGARLEGEAASAISLDGERVVVIHATTGKLAAPVLGQALLAPLLLAQRGAQVVETIAICGEDAPALRRIAEEKYGIGVMVTPNARQSATTARKPGMAVVREYWESTWKPKGASLLESCQLPAGSGPQSIDGLIVVDGRRQHEWSLVLDNSRIAGKQTLVVHADPRPKARYSLWLLGASLFLADIVREQFGAASVQPMVLTARRDDMLGPLAGRFGIEVATV
jgi:hypothetical protein